jgi:hypothetical protein
MKKGASKGAPFFVLSASGRSRVMSSRQTNCTLSSQPHPAPSAEASSATNFVLSVFTRGRRRLRKQHRPIHRFRGYRGTEPGPGHGQLVVYRNARWPTGVCERIARRRPGFDRAFGGALGRHPRSRHKLLAESASNDRTTPERSRYSDHRGYSARDDRLQRVRIGYGAAGNDDSGGILQWNSYRSEPGLLCCIQRLQLHHYRCQDQLSALLGIGRHSTHLPSK